MRLGWTAVIPKWGKLGIQRRSDSAHLVTVDTVGEAVGTIRFAEQVIALRSKRVVYVWIGWRRITSNDAVPNSSLITTGDSTATAVSRIGRHRTVSHCQRR